MTCWRRRESIPLGERAITGKNIYTQATSKCRIKLGLETPLGDIG